MRKKNGFTLVEIISVIGILLLISSVAIPSIITINKRNKEKNYERIVENIKTSSENFIEEYRNDIPFTDGKYYFRLNILGTLNLVKLPIKDPRSNENISENSCIKVTQESDESLKYNFPVTCPEISSELSFQIDNSTVEITKGEKVDLKSYVRELKSNITPAKYLQVKTEGTLNTNSIGNQTIEYYAIDLLNGTVSDKIPKTFTVKEGQTETTEFISVALVFNMDDVAYDIFYNIGVSEELDKLVAGLENKLNSNDDNILYDVYYWNQDIMMDNVSWEIPINSLVDGVCDSGYKYSVDAYGITNDLINIEVYCNDKGWQSIIYNTINGEKVNMTSLLNGIMGASNWKSCAIGDSLYSDYTAYCHSYEEYCGAYGNTDSFARVDFDSNLNLVDTLPSRGIYGTQRIELDSCNDPKGFHSVPDESTYFSMHSDFYDFYAKNPITTETVTGTKSIKGIWTSNGDWGTETFDIVINSNSNYQYEYEIGIYNEQTLFYGDYAELIGTEYSYIYDQAIYTDLNNDIESAKKTIIDDISESILEYYGATQ